VWRLKTLLSLLKQGQVKTALMLISKYALKTLNISGQKFRLKRTLKPFHVAAVASKAPLVSILIPNHNLSIYLDSCLKAISEQTYTKFEILIVNSGCNEENLSLAKNLKEKYTSLNISWFEGPLLPPGANRNFLANHAKGEFLFPIDPDDCMRPRLLQLTLQKALMDSLHIVAPSICLISDRRQNWHLWKQVTSEMLGFRNHLPACSLIEKKVFETIGGYRDFDEEGNRVHEDWEFFFRTATSGYRIGTLQAVLVDVMVRENSYSAKSELQDLDLQAALIKNMNRNLKGQNYSQDLAQSSELRLLRIDNSSNVAILLDSARISGTTRKASQAIQIIRSIGYEPIIFVSNPIMEGAEEIFDCETIPLFDSTVTEKYFLVISSILGESPVIWNIDTTWFYNSTDSIKKLNPSVELWDTLYLEKHRRTSLSKKNEAIDLRFLEFEKLEKLFKDGSECTLFPTHLTSELYRVGKSKRHPLTFGVLSRLSPEKNVSLSIEISRSYQERFSGELRLIIAGTGTMGSSLRSRYADLSFVEFIGEISGANKEKFLESIDLLLITSFVDGISAAAIEAIRFGVPVGILPGTPTADFISQNDYGVLLSTIPSVSAEVISQYLAKLPYLIKSGDGYRENEFVETDTYLKLVDYLRDRLVKHLN
jgi:glycosyltransferase involved in cell wall biosynthesis